MLYFDYRAILCGVSSKSLIVLLFYYYAAKVIINIINLASMTLFTTSYPKSHTSVLVPFRNSKRTINLQATKYSIVKEVALDDFNYQLGLDCYSLLWTDHCLSVSDFRLQGEQVKVNHIPEVKQITRKNRLANNLNNMKGFFPKEYNFFPQSFNLPQDLSILQKRQCKNKYFIVKPQNGCQGVGIFLTDSPCKLSSEKVVVQQYVSNPYLIEGLKSDIRIYVLITCINPLRVYLFKEGMVRLATEKFERPNQSNFDNQFSHLTNYAINKKNSKFEINEKEGDSGHKRLLSKVFDSAFLKTLYNKIGVIVNKTIISGLSHMQGGLVQCKNTDPGSYFQLLGFDILLNEKGDPLLLEVNQNPSLCTDTMFDYKLKADLVRNIFAIITGGVYKADDKFDVKVKAKDRHQLANLSNFERIYPCQELQQTEQYDKYILKVNGIYRDRFGFGMLRNLKREKERYKEQSIVQWNQQPGHYAQCKLEKVYGGRTNRTSQIRKRLLLL